MFCFYSNGWEEWRGKEELVLKGAPLSNLTRHRSPCGRDFTDSQRPRHVVCKDLQQIISNASIGTRWKCQKSDEIPPEHELVWEPQTFRKDMEKNQDLIYLKTGYEPDRNCLWFAGSTFIKIKALLIVYPSTIKTSTSKRITQTWGQEHISGRCQKGRTGGTWGYRLRAPETSFMKRYYGIYNG